MKRELLLALLFAGLAACKPRGPLSDLRADGDVAQAAGAALTPWQGVQLGAGVPVPTPCFDGAPAAWPAASAGDDPAYANVEIAPPGGPRFVAETAMEQAANPAWKSEVHALSGNVAIARAQASSFDDLLALFATGDASAGNWHIKTGFGPWLLDGINAAPATRANESFGVVILRRQLLNQRIDAPQTAAKGIAKTQDSYAKCGDAFVSGRVVHDNFFVLLSAGTESARDTAMTALTPIAAGRGDLAQNLAALEAAGNGGVTFLVASPGTGGSIAFQALDPGNLEARINSWIESSAPSGVRSSVAVVTPYAEYAADPGDQKALNAALTRLARNQKDLLVVAGPEKTTGESKIAELRTAIEACGGRRLVPACATLGQATTNAVLSNAPELIECATQNVVKPYKFGTECRPGTLIEQGMQASSAAKVHDFLHFSQNVYSGYMDWIKSNSTLHPTYPLLNFYAISGRHADELPNDKLVKIREFSFTGPLINSSSSYSLHSQCIDFFGQTDVCQAEKMPGAYREFAMFVLKDRPSHVPVRDMLRLFFWEAEQRSDPDRPFKIYGSVVSASPCDCTKGSDPHCKWLGEHGYSCKKAIGWVYR